MVLILVIGLGVVGCVRDKGAEAMVEKGIEKLKDVKSRTTVITFTTKVTVETYRDKLPMNKEGKVILNQNFEDKVAYQEKKITSNVPGMGIESKTYVVGNDGNYTKYLYDEDSELWDSEATYGDDVLLQLYPLIKNIKGIKPKRDGFDEVDKRDTNKVKVKMDGESLKTATDMIATMDDDVAMLVEGMDLKETLVTEIEYYQESGLPASMDIDLTGAMNEDVEKVLANNYDPFSSGRKFQVDELSVHIEYMNYNNVNIEVPKGV